MFRRVKKFDRDFRENFYGIEACLFKDEKEIIRKFARYTEVVHLWNVKISGNLENNHFPALPSLKVEDGWAPILLGCFYIGGVKNVSR